MAELPEAVPLSSTRGPIRPGQRKLTPPPPDQLNQPDTYREAMPAPQAGPRVNTATDEDDSEEILNASSIVHPNILSAEGNPSFTPPTGLEAPPAVQRFPPPPVVPLEEPLRSADVWVVVLPTTTFHTFIGDRTWYFTKDTKVKVPKSVAEILGNSRKIYPKYV